MCTAKAIESKKIINGKYTIFLSMHLFFSESTYYLWKVQTFFGKGQNCVNNSTQVRDFRKASLSLGMDMIADVPLYTANWCQAPIGPKCNGTVKRLII